MWVVSNSTWTVGDAECCDVGMVLLKETSNEP